MGNCYHFELSISHMHFICFRFCLLFGKLDSERHCQVKKHHDAVHSSRNPTKQQ